MVGWWIQRDTCSITSLIRVLLSGKSKGVIEERSDKSKCRLINYMHVKKGHNVSQAFWYGISQQTTEKSAQKNNSYISFFLSVGADFF